MLCNVLCKFVNLDMFSIRQNPCSSGAYLNEKMSMQCTWPVLEGIEKINGERIPSPGSMV